MLKNLKNKNVLLALASFTITVLMVFAVWNRSQKNDDKLVKENVIQTGNLVSKEFKSIVKADIAHLQNLKNRIEFTNGAYLEHWEKDANMLIKQNKSFKFLEWIDSSMVIRKINPLKGNENVINLDISKVEYRREEWIKHSLDGSTNITQWANLTQGGNAFLVDIPVYFQDRFQGTITAGMDFKENFNKLAANLENRYTIKFWDDKSTLFYELNAHYNFNSKDSFVYKDSILVDPLDNQKWLLNVSANKEQILSQAKFITNLFLVVGLIFCVLISFLVYFYLSARESTKLALGSNVKLSQTNKKLIKARKIAEKASQAKSEFLSNMSHEIRTPLHAILGFIELLKSSKLNNTDKEYLDLMSKSSNNLLSIVNDILDFEKIESGQIELAEVCFNPSEKIKELLEVNQFLFLKKRLYLKGNFNNTHNISVIGDESKLLQVVSNIIKNGLKFTNSGGVTLTYNEAIVNTNQLRINISIQDSGIGIPKNKLDTIFERFTQVENSIKKQFEGSGLGLAISKIFIEMMGGKIAVSSVPDVGTNFEFDVTFPIAKEENQQLTGYSLKNVALSDLSVLIVDDNNLNIIVLKKFLEDLGINSDAAKNGKIALEKFKTKKYQLVFMDIHMPVMDGWEATTEIRKLDKEVVIFGLSANVTKEAIDKALENGMNNYISKPFKKENIYNLLNFHFSTK
ncbi:response regulator [Hwangdonia lutea]|uniref:histidine kinase n=1 Tax=Hwangdonia lutea TaxID=3075823 RepID=A0AA97EML2_9FLAO|nr:response regulator [Hwangdonia sp. SCSIO 19198]WOD44097.1 response regulator [Hwangdonia sp. SCSIO 19198]